MKYMVIMKLLGVMLILALVGCASTGTATKAAVATSDQFRIESINFKFDQLVTPGIEYHTPAELEKMLKEKVVALLNEKQLLSDKVGVNTLKIDTTYQRRFVGDGTPAPSDALAYPHYSYKIDVMDGAKNIGTIAKDDLTFSGGMMMNLQVIAASLSDKKYEIEFIDALANTIVKEIEDL